MIVKAKPRVFKGSIKNVTGSVPLTKCSAPVRFPTKPWHAISGNGVIRPRKSHNLSHRFVVPANTALYGSHWLVSTGRIGPDAVGSHQRQQAN